MRKHLGKMQRLFVAELMDLFAATESIRNENRHRPRRIDRGQQPIVCDRFRHCKLLRFKAKRPCHATASRLDRLNAGSRAPQQFDFVCRPTEDSLVMTMPMNQDVRALKPSCRPIRRLGCEPIRKQPYLSAQPPCAHRSGRTRGARP